MAMQPAPIWIPIFVSDEFHGLNGIMRLVSKCSHIQQRCLKLSMQQKMVLHLAGG